MKVLYTASVATMMLLAFNANAESKFDVASRTYANVYQAARLNPGAKHIQVINAPFDVTASRGAETAACVGELADGHTADDIAAFGLNVTTSYDEFFVAEGLVEDFIKLADSDVVKAISFTRESQPMLDQARKLSGIDDMHSGTGFDTGYRGEGIICGIFDSGIDPNHVNFYNTDFTENRVKRFWRYTSTGGGSIEYADDKVANATTDSETGTHGTHTLGCMSGNHNRKGSSTKYPKGSISTSTYDDNGNYLTGKTSAFQENPYYGSAPDATIAACGGSLTDANIMNGMQKIAEYAKAQGKPCVINLSLGNVGGPHDGSSTICKFMDKLVDDYGVIVCIASGNDGDVNFTIRKNLTSSDKEMKTFLSYSSNVFGSAQIYASDNKDITFGFGLYDTATNKITYTFENSKASGERVVATSNYSGTGYVHDQAFLSAFSNGYVLIGNGTTTTNRRYSNITYNLPVPNGTVKPVIFVKGSEGQIIDVVNVVQSGNVTMTSNNVAGYSNATPDLSVNDMATGNNTICVGSWSTRHAWKTVTGTYSYRGDPEYNQVSSFSSYGKLYDGRVLPHVLAPGMGIISSYNSYFVEKSSNYSSDADVVRLTWNNRTYVWQVEQGTSMATPIAAGVVATWLEAYPQLTVSEARNILMSTAENVTNPSNSEYKTGSGKMNAAAGMKKVIELRNSGGVNDILADDNADDIIVSCTSRGVYDIFTGAETTSAVMYNLNGVQVAEVHSDGNSVILDASGLANGIYVLSINGHSRRVALH